MRGSGDSMALRDADAPAPEVEERSDEAPGAGGAPAGRAPDPEVVAKPKRRQFSAEYRLRILKEADRCTQPGKIGRLLRREGLYSHGNEKPRAFWGAIVSMRPVSLGLPRRWFQRLLADAAGKVSGGIGEVKRVQRRDQSQSRVKRVNVLDNMH